MEIDFDRLSRLAYSSGAGIDSDTGSKGFYSPLAQLNAIKQHLDATWKRP